MALNLSTNPTMSGRITAPDANYPYGSSKDETGSGANDGTPYFKARADDILGFQQALLTEANIVPTGNADTVLASQQLDAAKIVLKSGRKNELTNGGFPLWQRQTSQTSSSYGSDDRWLNANGVSTKIHSRNTFSFGQTSVPGNPEFYSRTVVTSIAGVASHVLKTQKIEGVETLSGEDAVISFYMRSAVAGKICSVEFVQNFGTGGAPSPQVTGMGTTKITLSTLWQKFVIKVSVDSVVGKTKGTNNNDFLGVTFWFDAGSDFDSRTDSLGHQSGTFDLAQVQLEKGTVATDFEVLPIMEVLALCERFYRKTYNLRTFPGALTLTGAAAKVSETAILIPHLTDVYFGQMRATPVLTFYSPLDGSVGNCQVGLGNQAGLVSTLGESSAVVYVDAAVVEGTQIYFQLTFDSEL